MKKSYSPRKLLYIACILLFFGVGCLILQRPWAILFMGLFVVLFVVTLVRLIDKLEALEQQNSINLERFTVSLEHVSHVLFDNVLEADMTNDCLIGENAAKLTELLAIWPQSSYNQTIEAISQKMVRWDFAEEYRKTLCSENVLQTLAQGRNTLEFECVERSDGQQYRWIRVHYCIYQSAATQCVKVISYVKNIEEEKRAYSRLVERAATDQMTGFLNKIATKEIMTDLLQKHAAQSNTLMMIDIDNFKCVNDQYGHTAGDEVILAICDCIKTNFRDTDIMGRMGGDEFLVCLREGFTDDSMRTKVELLLKDIEELTVEVKGRLIQGVTVSVGVVNTFGNDNFDQLYHYADTAMYKAKAKGKNQYYFYDYLD